MSSALDLISEELSKYLSDIRPLVWTNRGRISDNAKSNALWPKTLAMLPGSFIFHWRALTARLSPFVHQQERPPVSVTSQDNRVLAAIIQANEPIWRGISIIRSESNSERASFKLSEELALSLEFRIVDWWWRSGGLCWPPRDVFLDRREMFDSSCGVSPSCHRYWNFCLG